VSFDPPSLVFHPSRMGRDYARIDELIVNQSAK
jgi:hypothetical protein